MLKYVVCLEMSEIISLDENKEKITFCARARLVSNRRNQAIISSLWMLLAND